MSVHIRDLRGIKDYQAVVELERAIWGYTDLADVVTVPVFIITVKRGGILVGAFDGPERMVSASRTGGRRSGRT
jgi:predicted GNAT superfamily acetyltransferase